MKVLIEGFPTISTYLDKDNKPKAALKVNASILEVFTRSEKIDDTEGNEPYTLPEVKTNETTVALTSDDIPF